MTISRVQLREAAHLINQMLRDVVDGWKQRHFSTWRSA